MTLLMQSKDAESAERELARLKRLHGILCPPGDYVPLVQPKTFWGHFFYGPRPVDVPEYWIEDQV